MTRAGRRPGVGERSGFGPRPDSAARRALRRKLLGWYRSARRDLPWRRTSDAYAIWISEAMLQQTRVETVVPYWERFLERFPDVRALAAADEDDVLAAWSGLGYYRRARSLQRAARVIVEEHEGAFPRTRDEALALPGVGPYTAGAVLSIAYDRPVPLVDGNVARVLCRAFGLDADPASGELTRELWARAEELLPERGSGDWNQALMELGARVCTSAEARCSECPWSGSCVAEREGRTAELPRPKARREPVGVELRVAWVHDGARTLVEQRPESGRMAGMWQFPTVELPRADRGAALFPAAWRVDGALELSTPIGTVRHSITHHRIQAHVFRGCLEGRVAAPWAWVDEAGLDELALTGMTRKIRTRLLRSPELGFQGSSTAGSSTAGSSTAGSSTAGSSTDGSGSNSPASSGPASSGPGERA